MTQLQARPTAEVWQDRPLHPLAAAHVTRLGVAGVTATPAMRSALNILAWTIQTIGVAKFLAVWPFIGGTAAAHALDLQNAYNVTWNGTLTHDAQGVRSNGSTGYGATGLIPSVALASANSSFGFYCTQDASPAGNAAPMGCNRGTTGRFFFIWIPATPTFAAGHQSAGGAETHPASGQTVKTGFHLSTITTALATTYYRNAGVVSARTQTGTLPETDNVYLCANNSTGVAGSFCILPLGFSYIGRHLTAGEVTTLNKGVHRAQQILGRAV